MATETVLDDTQSNTQADNQDGAKPGETQKTETQADASKGDQKTDHPAPKWPDQWREEMAGALADNASDDEKAEHEKLLKRLKRFNTPADAAKALREQDKLISSSKRPLPKNPTAEQLAEWRKDNGIPESADKYDLTLEDGLVIGDADKPIVDAVVKDMHSANASNDVVKKMVSSYLKQREAHVQEIQQRNSEAKQATEDALREEWGQDYRSNVAGIESMLTQAGSSVLEAVAQARMPDGTAMLNNPDVVRWLAGHSRELGFVGATVVPNGGDIGKGVADELEALNDLMRKDPNAWAKNEKAQKRWIELKETQMRLDKRK